MKGLGDRIQALPSLQDTFLIGGHKSGSVVTKQQSIAASPMNERQYAKLPEVLMDRSPSNGPV